MSKSVSQKSVRIFAPAKLNLYLHVTGKTAHNFHTLDSLVSFADVGDHILIEPARHFQFEVHGAFKHAFSEKELDGRAHSRNLVVRAAYGLSELLAQQLNLKISLTKNLPFGAGLGGGSADGAATIWGLLDYWQKPKAHDRLGQLMISLGADVPVCFHSQTSFVEGIGDRLIGAPALPEIPIVIIYPGKSCHTRTIFNNFGSHFAPGVQKPEAFQSSEDLVRFLETTDNSLTRAAKKHAPEIDNVLRSLRAQDGCMFARMSGSGSSCFGFFNTEDNAKDSAAEISIQNPDWWVQSAWLGRTARY